MAGERRQEREAGEQDRMERDNGGASGSAGSGVVGVTGGSGRLGRAVVRDLQRYGYEVRVYDAAPPAVEDIAYTRGDILDAARLAAWIHGCDALVHLAAIPAPGLASDDWLTVVDVLGTYRVLSAAAQAGVRRVVLASSLSALGLAFGRRFPIGYLPLDEHHPLTPEDAYGAAKAVNEVHAGMFARRFAMAVAALRFPTILEEQEAGGFRQTLANDPELAARLLWSYVHVDDAAQACRLALERTPPGVEAYYVTAPDHFAGPRVMTALLEYYPGVVFRPGFDPQRSLVSSAKAAQLLGYRPTRSLQAS
jgi:nucleoside-diphosphate-sugar epimerase